MIFKKGEMEKLLVDCYNILTIRIDIIGIYMNIISEIGFFYHSIPLSFLYSFGRWIEKFFHLWFFS